MRVAPQVIVPQCGEAFDEMGGEQPLSTSYQHSGKKSASVARNLPVLGRPAG